MKKKTIVPAGKGAFSLPEDYSSGFSGVIIIERDGEKLVINQGAGVCAICGEPAVDYLFGKGVCDLCINHAKVVRERGY